MRKLIVYILVAAALWLCGQIANGQPPGHRLPACRVAADVGQAVEVVRAANRDYLAALERLHADMVRLLDAERKTTTAMERCHAIRTANHRR